jgi:homoserine trans-succinylase
MPIVINTELQGLSNRLRHAGAVVLDEEQALKQDIRPARIGLIKFNASSSNGSNRKSMVAIYK